MSKLVAAQAMVVGRDAPLQQDVAIDIPALPQPPVTAGGRTPLVPKSCWKEDAPSSPRMPSHIQHGDTLISLQEFDMTDQRPWYHRPPGSRKVSGFNQNRRSVSMEIGVNHWASQLFSLLLTLGHCSCFVADVHHMSTEELKELSLWTFFTFVPLYAITVFELLVRVQSQTEGMCHWTYWLRFLKPLFHKLEIAVLCFMFARSCLSAYNLYLGITYGELSEETHGSDKMSVLVLIFYRGMRAWDIVHKISVQQTEQQWLARQAADPPWLDEHEELLMKYNSRFVVKIQRVIDQGNVQVLIFIIVLAHCGIYSFTRIVGWDKLFWYTKPSGYLLLMIFFTEFVSRCYAQGGELFFEPLLHKIEVVFLALGVFMVGYSTWYHAAIKEEKTSFEFAGSATAVVITIHRFFRFIGVWYGVSASALEVHSVIEAKGIEFLKSKLGNLLQVPPENFRLSLPGVHDGYAEVALRKAHLNPAPLGAMHLPLTLSGGLVEEFYLRVPAIQSNWKTNVRAEKPDNEPCTTLTITNLLLIVGPGDGLAEAGGLKAPEQSGKYWEYENVLEAKGKLVDFLFKHLGPSPPDKMKKKKEEKKVEEREEVEESDEEEGHESGDDEEEEVLKTAQPGGRAGMFAKLKASGKDWGKSYGKSMTRRAQVHIKNVTVQYQDRNGLLGRGYVTIGAKVGKITFDRTVGEMTRAYISRMGMFIETQTKAEASQKDTGAQKASPKSPDLFWRTDLCEDLGTKYGHRKTMNRYKHQNSWELFLQILFTNFHIVQPLTQRQKHLHSERWPGRKFIWWAAGIRLIGKAMEEEKSIAEQQKSVASASPSLASSSQQLTSNNWHWNMSVTPVRICIDDEQIRCVRSLKNCLKAFFIYDTSFGWRPDVGPQDRKEELEVLMNRLGLDDSLRRSLRLLERGPHEPEQAVELLKDVLAVTKTDRKKALEETRRKVEESLNTESEARRMVWRMWWIYAISRVMARQHVRPNTPWVALGWHTVNRKQYMMLLNDVVDRSHITSKKHLHDWRWSTWQTRWARELEVRLAMPEIIACRKLAMGICLRRIEHHADEKKAAKAAKTLSSQHTMRHSILKSLKNTPRMTQQRSKKAAGHCFRFCRTVKEGRLKEAHDLAVDATVKAPQELKKKGRALAHSAAETGVGLGYKIAEKAHILNKGKNQTAQADSGRDRASSNSDVETPNKDPIINKAAGTWKIEIPEINIRVLRWSVVPRKVLLHTQMKHIVVSLQITGTSPSATPSPPLESIVVSASLGTFSVKCPQAGKLVLNGGDEMLTVTRPLQCQEFLDSSIPRPNLPDLTPTLTEKALREDGIVYSGRFLFLCPKEEPALRDDGQEGGGIGEVMFPDVRIVVFESLYIVLMSYLTPIAEIGSTSRRRGARAHVNPPQLRQEAPVSKRMRPHISQGIIASTGRQGPMVQRIEFNDTEDAVDMATRKTSFHAHCHKIISAGIKKRRMNKAQKKFELFSGMKHGMHHWDIKLDMGSMHVMQVGEYSNTQVFVEDYRFWPFCMDLDRGLQKIADAMARARSMLTKKDNHIMVEANKHGVFPQWGDFEELGTCCYVVTEHLLTVTLNGDQESAQVTRLPSGTRVNVVELLEQRGKTRGRIDHPPGWITLKTHSPDRLFAYPCKYVSFRPGFSREQYSDDTFGGFYPPSSFRNHVVEFHDEDTSDASADWSSNLPSCSGSKKNCCANAIGKVSGSMCCDNSKARLEGTALPIQPLQNNAYSEVVEFERKAEGSTVGWQSKNPTVEVAFRAIDKAKLKQWIIFEDGKWCEQVQGRSQTDMYAHKESLRPFISPFIRTL